MKFNCKDELVELLKKKGYSLVLLPRENIRPFQILSRTEKGIWAWVRDVFKTPRLEDTNAQIDELFITDSQALPTVIGGDVVNDVRGKRSSSLSVEAAVELMVNFLSLPEEGKTEEQKIKLKAAMSSVSKVNFAFGGDTRDESVSHIGLDSYLKDAEIRDTVGNTFLEMIGNNQLFIVTSVLKSTSFTMKGSTDNNASVEFNLPKIKEILNGKINGNLDIFEESGLKYKGEKQLVFGFKGVKLIADKKGDGKYAFKIQNEEGLALRGEEDFIVDELSTEENFLEI